MTRSKAWLTATMVAMVAVAQAGWEGTKICRLNDDRVLLVAGTQRFVLTHAAAWEPADPAQKDAIVKWLDKAKLPRDLGLLITSVPADNKIPLGGEIDAVQTATETNLTVKIKDAKPRKLTLAPAPGGGAQFTPDSLTPFGEISKAWNKPPSTLLLLLAEKTGTGPEAGVLGAFVERLKKSTEFFVYLDKTQGLVWVRNVGPKAAPNTASQAAQPSHRTTKPSAIQVVDSGAKPGTSTQQSPILYSVIIGVLVLIGGGFLARRALTSKKTEDVLWSASAPTVTDGASKSRARSKAVVSPPEPEVPEGGSFEVSSFAADPATAVEEIVGRKADRQVQSDLFRADPERKEEFQQAQSAGDSLQQQLDAVNAQAKENAARAAEAIRAFEEERKRVRTLTEELRRAQAEVSATQKELQEADKLIGEITQWGEYLSDRINTVVEQMESE